MGNVCTFLKLVDLPIYGAENSNNSGVTSPEIRPIIARGVNEPLSAKGTILVTTWVKNEVFIGSKNLFFGGVLHSSILIGYGHV